MTADEVCEVVITAPDWAWLADLTRQLVTDRLAACGHNIAGVQSTCRWRGEMQDRVEAQVAIHTRRSHLPAIIEVANRDHPYELACVVATPIVGGSPGYLQWVLDETGPAHD